MLKAVIFDFDGVITDTEILHFNAFNQVLAKYDIQISLDDYYKYYLGLTDADCFKLLSKEGRLKANEQELINITACKWQLFDKLVRKEWKIIDGAGEFIKRLYENKIKLAIYSGALLPEIEFILKASELHKYFEVIISAEQVTKAKPDPQGFKLALKRLNDKNNSSILPEECIVVEDAFWGLAGAIAAGMHTVAVTNSYHAEKLTMAEKIVERLDNLTLFELQELCS